MNGTEARSIGGRKQLLADEVFRHIGTAIIEGDLAAGARIRDVEVAMELHVSRMPVREALQRLERIGLVTMYPSRYTEVSEATEEVIEQSREFAGFQAGFASHLAARQMNDEARTAAVTLVDALIEGLDDPAQTTRLRQEVFMHLSQHSGNELLHSLMHEASLALTRNLRGFAVTSEHRERTLNAYRALRTALVESDSIGAERAAREIHQVY